MDDSQPSSADLLKRIDALEAVVAELRSEVVTLRLTVAQRDERIVVLEAELARRDRWKRGSRKPKAKNKKGDRRRRGKRKHVGQFRAPPVVDEKTVLHHDVRQDACPKCQSSQLVDTGKWSDHVQVDIPEPKLDIHRFRRHEQLCETCGCVSCGRGELELPGAHLGPRIRLFEAFARAHLGLSLGKANDLLEQLYGLRLSRAGALGHIHWAGNLLDPVVRELWTILRESSVVHADETGWRINGRTAWAWCFSNPQLALFLIEKRRSAAVIRKALGDSLPGVLVTDFYSAYQAIDARKQKCLTHLLRELRGLREKLSRGAVRAYLQPLMTLMQDAIHLGKTRQQLSSEEYQHQVGQIEARLDTLIFSRPQDTDCNRINRRLVRHRFELFTFLTEADVPPDNNPGERDIRSLAAARSDGGVHRAPWSARAFATIKSVVATCRKNGLRFIDYGLSVLRAAMRDCELPSPLTADTS